MTLKRLGEVSTGHLFIRIEEFIFDFLLYPYMLYDGGFRLLRIMGFESATTADGYYAGAAIMFTSSAFTNIIYIIAYDRMGRDWFGIEAVRKFKPAWLLRLPRWLLPIGRGVAFIVLCLWTNPLFALLWIRSKAGAFRMNPADWAILGLAILIANIGWIGAIGAASLALQFAGNQF